MRTKKAVWNIVSAMITQIVTVICGFILPRAILTAYGSDTNGIISSATQFLGYISLLEAGVGGVTRAALYRPLANGEWEQISGTLKATENFFRKLAYIFFVYAVIISLVFPHIINSEKSDLFVTGIVLIVSISTFVQYYFGITYSIFLQADQRNYITKIAALGTTVMNTMLSVILIKLGFGIHAIKLCTAVVYVFRPLFFNWYVKRNYPINLKCRPDNKSLKNRWAGLAHHVAWYLHSNTDIAILTIFMNAREVSVYSIYLSIINGISNLSEVVTNGIDAGFGDLIAKGEIEKLKRMFRIYELMISMFAITLFMTAADLIIPFINIYTSGVSDVNYVRSLVAWLMIASGMIYCFRLPYHSVTLAAGHYVQTKKAAFVEVGLNISLSLVLVNLMGMPGTVLATVIAVTYRLCHYAWYLSKNILQRNISLFLKRLFANILTVLIILAIDRMLPGIDITNYKTFAIEGCILVAINLLITFFMNFVLFREDMNGLMQKMHVFMHH